jgi:hypothetical protein
VEGEATAAKGPLLNHQKAHSQDKLIMGFMLVADRQKYVFWRANEGSCHVHVGMEGEEGCSIKNNHS